ncbi:PIG-L deacetylase family protein [Ornithinimicrobium cryptoxanthini]|uniref:PIG-L family deacetylase n=1 Tax=Ornithinimicrobium cryptoxanthini TaxID=2934161 RepID=A0ABY4YLF7_9MICO|nr:PIG-L deacetylase family protein [Ornithinimicrobium cryptoxanthini]USQ77178.1 PIG-L family deacetylase [Ornithinimicrobium cryptoxanthini]
MAGTVVALFAHPDDEALLTGGTLAMLAAQGHRIVFVVATDGALGLASEELRSGDLAATRLAELEASARALGAAEVISLGHSDSGHGAELWGDPPGRRRFVTVPVDEVAAQVADIVRHEGAEVLISCDARGGYGHRDHIHVHQVGRRVRELTGVRLLEATAPREPLLRALRLVGRVRRFRNGFDPSEWEHAFTPRREITHRISIGRHLRDKQSAMRAHFSQTTGGESSGGRTLASVLRLPPVLSRLVLGREFFQEVGVDATPLRTAVFEVAR